MEKAAALQEALQRLQTLTWQRDELAKVGFAWHTHQQKQDYQDLIQDVLDQKKVVRALQA